MCAFTGTNLVQAGFISTPQRAEERSWHCPERKRERVRERCKPREAEIEERDGWLE